jgi:uncharacterized membrane protein
MPTTLAAAGLKTLAGHDSAVARAVDRLPAMPTNLNDVERVVSAAVGVGLLAAPVRGLPGLLAKFAGGALLLRGATGHCMGYQMLGLSSCERRGDNRTRAEISVPHDAGVRVEETVVVGRRTPDEVYRFWRDYANLPKFQGMVTEVRDLGGGRSHWVGTAPGGLTLEWDAELIGDEPGRLISWRSLPGGDLGTAGSVHFDGVPGGTRVHVNVKFDPPGGKLAHAVAKLLGQDPATQTRRDLQTLKQLLEGGR